MSEKRPFHIALIPLIHRKLKVTAAGYGVVPGDLFHALFDTLEVIEGMNADPDFRKRYLAILKSCLRDIGMDEQAEEMDLNERVRIAKEEMAITKARFKKQSKNPAGDEQSNR